MEGTITVDGLIGEPRADLDLSLHMTGEESYPVCGPLLYPSEVIEIMRRCKGLQLTGDCLAKAKIAYDIVARGLPLLRSIPSIIAQGMMRVESICGTSTYGFDYHPPLEFHAWLEFGDGNIIDVSLPGVIYRGQHTCDEIGPFLSEKTPQIILAGRVQDAPMRLIYKRCT